ncbi:MAG: phosphoglucosamine mutase [Thermovirgaceae bacterium]|nr:phosphoglucosamine mutase [Thermovirgaceae bacterium]
MPGCEKNRCLFGTDGVRDVANRGIMTPEMALRLGRSYVLFLIESGVSRPSIAVGRDTRRSGPMIESALIAGLTSAGADVSKLGIIPTPGVSFAVSRLSCSGGAVVSASHNPSEYNGIKFLGPDGSKLSDDSEAEIEDYLGDILFDEWRPTGSSVGCVLSRRSFCAEYADWVVDSCCINVDRDLSVVVDCANGAASPVAGELFRRCFRNPVVIEDNPDGTNINEQCGVMHTHNLASRVVAGGHDLGLALDGDADRVLFVDGKGRLIDGDIMLWIIGKWLSKEHRIGGGVVATVMSNKALEEHLQDEGIPVTRCAVGDRYVLEAMRNMGARLGGEQSGHVIASEYVATGDGLCSGLLFLTACRVLGEDMGTLVDRFGRYPQALRNFHSLDKDEFLRRESVEEAVSKANRELGESGRVLVRPSGTEPLVRVLVEAKDDGMLRTVSESLFAAIRKEEDGNRPDHFAEVTPQ